MANVIFIIQREAMAPARSIQPKVLFPVEAATTAAVLIKAGHKVRCLDLNLLKEGQSPEKGLRRFLDDFAADLLVSAPQMLTFLINEKLEDTVRLFETARRRNKNIKTVYAGVFATSYPAAAFKKTAADYLVRGELEAALPGIIENALHGGTIRIPGVICADSDYGAQTISVTDSLDVLPLPAYEEFNYKSYFRYPGRGNLRFPEYSRRYTHYQTSRGCTCQCCFCNVAFLRGGRRYRMRSIPLVLDDLEMLNKKYGIREVHFLDENITLNKNRVLGICRGIKARGLDFKWIAAGGMSVYTLDEEVLKAMRGAGCYRLNLAFESGSQEVLDTVIKKPVRLQRDVRVLGLAKEMGFEIIGYFVVGLPAETRAQLKETLNLAANPLFDYVTLSIATPQEGTRLQDMCTEKKLINRDSCLAGASRRAAAMYSTKEFSAYELERIRWEQWDKINFSTLKRRNTLHRMMGLSLKGIEVLRKKTAADFKKRWPQDFIITGKRVGLARLGRKDLKTNLLWMKDPGLRRLIERPPERLTYKKQLDWLNKLGRSDSKIVLKIITLDNRQAYIGNVSAFNIDLKGKAAQISIFIAARKYRRQGYGTEALALLIEYARSLIGQKTVFGIKLLSENAGAYKTYKKLGFRDCKKNEFDFKCDDNAKRIYMVLSGKLNEKQG